MASQKQTKPAAAKRSREEEEAKNKKLAKVKEEEEEEEEEEDDDDEEEEEEVQEKKNDPTAREAPPDSGPIYLVTRVEAEDSGDTHTFRIPAEKVTDEFKDALRKHHGGHCNPNDEDPEFRRACKFITYQLDVFGDYMLDLETPHKMPDNMIVDSFMIIHDPDREDS